MRLMEFACRIHNFKYAFPFFAYFINNLPLLHPPLPLGVWPHDRRNSNERLEFLGDSVLGLVICHHVYDQYPETLEGELTILKSAVVSRKTCAAISNATGLTGFIAVGPGMDKTGRLPHSLAAGVFESVVGAIYLDGGFAAARKFILAATDRWVTQFASSMHQQNFKSVLQQHTQRHSGGTPTYEVMAESGPAHEKSFCIRVLAVGKTFESAGGHPKKQAEQQAAFNALRELGVTADLGIASGAEHLNGDQPAIPANPE